MKPRKGSITSFVLEVLQKASDKTAFLEDFTYSGQIRALKGIQSPANKRSFDEAVRRLKLKGIVEKERDAEGKIIVKLTTYGKDYLFASTEEEWDGKYRIIIWDIPENKRRVRDLLRRRLKDWGFESWQRSVWVSKRNVTKKMRDFVAELKIEKWVAIIESDDPSLSLIKFHDRGRK